MPVPVERIVEERVPQPYEVIKEVKVPVEVVRKVEVPVPVERIVEVKVPQPYEVIKEVPVYREVVRNVYVDRPVPVPVVQKVVEHGTKTIQPIVQEQIVQQEADLDYGKKAASSKAKAA